ncbi:hypothetical protein [Actinomadura sp. NTSP31]|uniref:hypothetical protein n=1 Tax=Actinomadura sp. NTSP31 TaxID=1735447 RepID=UPI0035C06485
MSADATQRQHRIDDPGRIPEAVEEILRMEAAVAPGRHVTRDIELGGVRLKAEGQLPVLLAAPNHDAGEFADSAPGASTARPTVLFPRTASRPRVRGRPLASSG